MRYIPLVVLILATLVTPYLMGIVESFSLELLKVLTIPPVLLFVAFVLSPMLVAILLDVLYLVGKIKTQVFSIAGAAVSLLAVLAYYDAFTYQGSDGQVALIFAVMPIYQFILMPILAGVFKLSSKLYNRLRARG